MPPDWLEALAWVSLVSAGIVAAVILVDILVLGYRQRMGVMEWVWPITALYLVLVGLFLYWRVGRRQTAKYEAVHGKHEFPHRIRVLVSSTHCGGGCTLGDILAETMIYVFGITLFGAAIWASFVLDYTFAMVFGIAFQFAAIRAMTKLPFRATLARAAKADVLSLSAFEVGLFSWMALTYWVFFPDPHLTPDHPTYWFMMQIGMAIGLATSYPMNAFLIKKGIKEAM